MFFVVFLHRLRILGLLIAVAVVVAGLYWWVFPGHRAVTYFPAALPRTDILPGQSPPPSEYTLEPGYRLELVASQLTFPTAVTFGSRGEIYVAESGYSFGPATSVPRILQVFRGGRVSEVARLPDGPVTSIRYYEGRIYAIGGRAPAEVWRVDPRTGAVETVVTGLPAWGHHLTSELVFGPGGKMYFGVGTPSNSGVVGLDDYYTFGYLSIFPEACDIPAVDLKLAGRNFTTDNPFTADANDKAVTGAFKPFGRPSRPGEIIKAGTPPNVTGVVLRCNPDGSGLEVFASGFRNIYGMAFTPDGRLFGIDQGMDDGGSRPVANDFDPLWVITQGGWYGFPDFPSGIPITDPGFAPEDGPAPQPLLLSHPPLAEGPFFRFPPSSASHQFDFCRDPRFGFKGELFVAQYGSHFLHPPNGHKVVRLDLETKEATDFYVNLVPGPGGSAPERPTSAHFGPDGALYVVDFGELVTDGGVFFSSALTGALWRISKIAEPTAGFQPPTVQTVFALAVGVAACFLAGRLTRNWRSRRAR